MLFLQLLVHGFAHDTQIFPGIQQLDLVIDDIDVGPVGSLALHNDGIPAGVLQLGAPDAAGVGAGDHAGEGGLGDHHVTAGGGSRRAGHGAGDVDQLVFRGQGVHGGNALVIEQLGAQAPAADELVRQLQIQRLDLNLAGGQVDAGNFFVICASHMLFLPKICRIWLQFLRTFIISQKSFPSSGRKHFCVKLHETVSFHTKKFLHF